MFDASSTRLMISSDTQPYELITRRILDELDDVTIVLPIVGNIL